ncbi:DUF2550 domain-containing protein [Nocardioides sp. Kera G14]|uniref:DUF2550 domain-containing protein n=1 Tax=Nocardioides sp. Kera G14 TaxID=2884264 RepID=UPI001D128DEC|nr:DUF2550 domain-containing protein [Nocardioides sp. Kera G14]UDY24734.1 DUF2550 domain-containing protein [Nocardioides sp. Kera G14]
MALWEWLLDAVGVLLLLVVAYFLCLMVRRRIIARDGGTFELAYRVRASSPGRGWLLGIGRYSGETLEWFRVFSLAPAPKRRWSRLSLAYNSSRQPDGDEEIALYPGHVIVVCDYLGAGDGQVELAMAPDSLIGFQAWIESRNPGTDWSR